MRVKDKVTGNILESDNDIVTDGWKANPDRFILPKSKVVSPEEQGNKPTSGQPSDIGNEMPTEPMITRNRTRAPKSAISNDDGY